MNVPLILSLVVAGGVVYALFGRKIAEWWRRRRPRRSIGDYHAYLAELLGGIDPDFTDSAIGSGGDRIFDLLYQDGNFRIAFNGTYSAELLFPNCFSVPREQLDALSELCNRAGRTYYGWVFSYAYHEEEDQLLLTISTRLVLAADSRMSEYLRATLRECFALRRQFVQTYDNERQEITAERVAEQRRENHLLAALAERRQQEAMPEVVRDPSQPVTLGEMLRFLDFENGRRLLKLDVLSHAPLTLVGPDDIRAYRPASALIGKDDAGTPVVINAFATLSLLFEDERTGSSAAPPPQALTIALSIYRDTPHVIYYRAAFLLPALSDEPQPWWVEAPDSARTAGLLFGYDKAGAARFRAEFDYMYREALDKVAAGKLDELTPQQELLHRALSPDVAHPLYWGKRFFLEGRDVEAVHYLSAGWRALKHRLQRTPDEALHDVFCETSYFLGFAYVRQGRYPEAYYYLSGLEREQTAKYTCLFVELLVNSHDMRALPFIDRELTEIETFLQKSEEEPSEALIEFRMFLLLHRGYVLYDYERWDEARTLFTALLSHEKTASKARAMLDRLDAARRAAAAASAPPPAAASEASAPDAAE